MALKRMMVPVLMVASATAVLMTDSHEDLVVGTEVSQLKSQMESLRQENVELKLNLQLKDLQAEVATLRRENSMLQRKGKVGTLDDFEVGVGVFAVQEFSCSTMSSIKVHKGDIAYVKACDDCGAGEFELYFVKEVGGGPRTCYVGADVKIAPTSVKQLEQTTRMRVPETAASKYGEEEKLKAAFWTQEKPGVFLFKAWPVDEYGEGQPWMTVTDNAGNEHTVDASSASAK